MKYLKRLLCLLLCASAVGFALAGCGDSDTTTAAAPNAPNPPPLPPPSFDWQDPALPGRLEAALQGWVNTFGLYGAAACVSYPGWLEWCSTTGVEDIEDQTPYTLNTLGRIASATKPFTAVAIFQLVEEGLLSLDTTLSVFLPDYPNADQITVEHLLRHRSGIPDVHLVDLIFIVYAIFHSHEWIPPEGMLLWTYAPFPMVDMDTFEFVPREPVTYPGGDYHYSNPGYNALGVIIEALRGKALADVYDEHIVQPLGMTNTRLPRKDDPPEPWGYSNLFGLLSEKIPVESLLESTNSLVSATGSAGGVIAVAKDLTTFLSGFLTGKLCSEASLAGAKDWMRQRPDDPDNTWEYGMGLSRHQRDGYLVIGHDGALPGAASVMRYIEELGVYVGAVTNTDKDSVPGAPGLEDLVRQALLNE